MAFYENYEKLSRAREGRLARQTIEAQLNDFFPGEIEEATCTCPDCVDPQFILVYLQPDLVFDR